ncbi:type II toxin-antitoxin system VapC family toxin [Rhizobium sp. C4]|uniref:type II toxin-antitoxin system VapC family toxin n=1 Tax=Rhizobium sp. C4 TaxID=1349800 RepID=UPI001E6111C9|nr:type II toxin-antitoxin system VapC family toxin [Rhizobium sp. C4]MCD2173170.1 type II toxin-antitoxin system VapC family toxin [Rhizobium sp. C4]
MTDGFMIDTNVISIFSPDRKEPAPEAARQWFHEQGEAGTLFLSAITIAEIEKGLRGLHRRGGIERARSLNGWLDMVVERFADRILPLDAVVGRHLGKLEDAAISTGHHPGLGDLIIAATARAYGLTVVTRNLRHFAPLGVNCTLPAAFGVEPSSPSTDR